MLTHTLLTVLYLNVTIVNLVVKEKEDRSTNI